VRPRDGAGAEVIGSLRLVGDADGGIGAALSQQLGDAGTDGGFVWLVLLPSGGGGLILASQHQIELMVASRLTCHSS
jgi:hypothetical protein